MSVETRLRLRGCDHREPIRRETSEAVASARCRRYDVQRDLTPRVRIASVTRTVTSSIAIARTRRRVFDPGVDFRWTNDTSSPVFLWSWVWTRASRSMSWGLPTGRTVTSATRCSTLRRGDGGPAADPAFPEGCLGGVRGRDSHPHRRGGRARFFTRTRSSVITHRYGAVRPPLRWRLRRPRSTPRLVAFSSKRDPLRRRR